MDPGYPSFILILLGWALAFLNLLAFLDFQPVVKLHYHPALDSVGAWAQLILLGVGVGAMTLGFRGLWEREAQDIRPGMAWVLLAMILGVATCLRLYHLHEPSNNFWDDWADMVAWCNIVRNLDEYYWMFPTSGREPFVPYVFVGMMELLSGHLHDYPIHRLTHCLIDLVALGFLYLCGKEMGSRRAGLVAAALGALGRPMLQVSLSGMRAFSVALAMLFLLWTTLRLLRQPSLSRYFLWGLGLAFGVHTYSSYRTFMLAVPFLLLFWVFADEQERKVHPLGWAAGVGAILLLAGVYSGTLAGTHALFAAWRDLWDTWAAHPVLMIGLFGGVLTSAGWALWTSRGTGAGSRTAGWALAVGMASAIIYPLTRHPEFDQRIGGGSIFHQGAGSGDLVGLAMERLKLTVRALFYFNPDRNDLLIAADPFFDVFSQGAMVLGFAFFLAVPRWKTLMLLAFSGIGLGAYLLSWEPSSTKLIAATPPLYLLAGLAFSRLWSGLPRSSRTGLGKLPWPILLGSLLTLYGAFGYYVQFGKLHGYWFGQGIPNDKFVALQVADYAATHRVYLAPAPYFFGNNSQFVLNQGKPYYILKDRNGISEDPDGKEKDLLVLVFGADRETPRVIRGQFPLARWEKVALRPDLIARDPNPELYFFRVFIPRAALTEDPGKLFFLRRGKGPWVRRYYDPYYGWGLSWIVREVRVGSFFAPIPWEEIRSERFRKFHHGGLLQSLGKIEAPQGGVREWSIDFSGPLWARIDGRTVFKRDNEGGSPVRFKKRLSPGAHDLEILMRLGGITAMPQAQWREGKGGWEPLDDGMGGKR